MKRTPISVDRARQVIDRFGIKKAAIARGAGVNRVYVYAYLDPEKYPHVRLDVARRRRIEQWLSRLAA